MAFYCFLRWYLLSDQQYENTGLDDEFVGTGNMDVLENELQGERINRIEKCLHVGADSSVSALGHTVSRVSALGHTVSRVSALGYTVSRVSALGNTVTRVSALGHTGSTVRTVSHSRVSALGYTVRRLCALGHTVECPWDTQLAGSVLGHKAVSVLGHKVSAVRTGIQS